MRIFLLVAAVLLIGHEAYSQVEAGFYLVTKRRGKCLNEMKLVNEDTKYCLEQRPIIQETSFKDVSEIFVDPATSQRAIVLQLDSIGSETLLTLTRNFKGTEMGLVVKKKLVSVIEIQKTVVNGQFIFRQVGESNEIHWIRQSILKIVKKK